MVWVVCGGLGGLRYFDGATFHLMCVSISFSSVWVAEWPPLGKELLTRFTICLVPLYF